MAFCSYYMALEERVFSVLNIWLFLCLSSKPDSWQGFLSPFQSELIFSLSVQERFFDTYK